MVTLICLAFPRLEWYDTRRTKIEMHVCMFYIYMAIWVLIQLYSSVLDMDMYNHIFKSCSPFVCRKLCLHK